MKIMSRVEFGCDLTAEPTVLPHFWEHTVGSDYAPMALRADWQQQLRRCHEELGFRYVRFHGLLCDDMGTLIIHRDKFLYSFFNADQIFDYLLSIGMKPFVELSFMPQALASGRKTVFRYRGNITPPKDYDAWAELIRRLVKHWVERYGAACVREWFFEVWNEPNLKSFWTGSQAAYFKLYRRTVSAIKEVDERLRVGGPATAANGWIKQFLDFCEKENLPADFVSTHHYPTDAFGKETDDTIEQLARAKRGILREQARKAKREARGKPLYYTEWNTSSNPRDELHDEPYAAAFVTKTVLEMNGLVDGYGFWTFTDIFAENYYPSVPFHGGFGLLNLHGIAKPVYRAFELLHRLGTELLPVSGKHETVDAWVVRGADKVTVILTNHALPRHAIETERVRVALAGLREPRAAFVERIDESNANPRRLWQEMGEPEYLSEREVERLRDASALTAQPHELKHEGEQMYFDIRLPPQSVAAVTIELARDFNSIKDERSA